MKVLKKLVWVCVCLSVGAALAAGLTATGFAARLPALILSTAGGLSAAAAALVVARFHSDSMAATVLLICLPIVSLPILASIAIFRMGAFDPWPLLDVAVVIGVAAAAVAGYRARAVSRSTFSRAKGERE